MIHPAGGRRIDRQSGRSPAGGLPQAERRRRVSCSALLGGTLRDSTDALESLLFEGGRQLDSSARYSWPVDRFHKHLADECAHVPLISRCEETEHDDFLRV